MAKDEKSLFEGLQNSGDCIFTAFLYPHVKFNVAKSASLQFVHSPVKLLAKLGGILKSQNRGAATEVLYMIPPHTKAIPL